VNSKYAQINQVAIITTGGTIAKTYDGERLINQNIVIDKILDDLQLPYLKFDLISLLNLDSRDFKDSHRLIIAKKTLSKVKKNIPVIITHGTDTMVKTGKFIKKYFKEKKVEISQPIVLTGSILPYSVKKSDAQQNLTEALLAIKILTAGIYIVFHNQVFPINNVRKNYKLKTFSSL